jgi:bifunctional UDP-N-acetylglucosamine pyrophosphorylase/glucosamine-1-phosphate N-acetyltransferase/UDP-N-acetylglucosamine pyrophosphorylase
MKSELPKVLFPVLGRPMIHYVLDALKQGGVGRVVVVVGYRAELVQAELSGRVGLEFALQAEQLGTGHAVMSCRAQLAAHDGPVVVMAGDAPMLQAATVARLLDEFDRRQPACLLGTIHNPNPKGLGRVVRDGNGRFVGVVEEKDATDAQRQITEVNMSYYVFDSKRLLAALDHIRADNAQREYYITDVPAVLAAQGAPIDAICCLQPCEALAVNNADELAAVEATLGSLHEAVAPRAAEAEKSDRS